MVHTSFKSLIAFSLALTIAVTPSVRITFADDGAGGTLDLNFLEHEIVSDGEPPIPAAGVSELELGTGASLRSLSVRLQDDGQLVGGVRVVYPDGKSSQVDAKMVLRGQDGVVGETSTDQTGAFRMADVAPGEYTANVSLANGSVDFQVVVQPYDQDALPGEMYLDASFSPTPELMPAEEPVQDSTSMVCVECGQTCSFPECGGAICEDCGELVCGECIEEVPCEICDAPQMDCCCASSGCDSCGGVGGGGFGWLGAAGLAAGLTALALNDSGDRPPASPVAP